MQPIGSDTTTPLALERLRRGLSCSDVARRARLSRQTVWRVETGRVAPHPSTCALLAAALGVDVAALFPKGARS